MQRKIDIDSCVDGPHLVHEEHDTKAVKESQDVPGGTQGPLAKGPKR